METVAPGVKNLCKLATPGAKPINQDNLVARRGLDHETSDFDLPTAIVGFPSTRASCAASCSPSAAAKILATAGLFFLGLGTQPPTANWGSMRPHVEPPPGHAIFAIVLP